MKMSFLIAVVMVTVGVALGAPTANPANPTYPCCMPGRYQARLIDVRAPSDLRMPYQVMVTDDTLQRVGRYVYNLGNDKPVRHYLSDYKNKKFYSIDLTSNNASTNCLGHVNTRPYVGGCISTSTTTITDLKYRGKSSMGSPSKSIGMDVWSYSFGVEDVIMALTEGSCLPVFQDVRTNKAYPRMQAYSFMSMFNQVTTNVTMPEILDIPAFCPMAENI